MENLNKVLNECKQALDDIENSKKVISSNIDSLFNEIHHNIPKEVDEIIKEIDSMPTDDVARIYYAIENSHHFSHLDKFKML